MDCEVLPSTIKGTIKVPPSKSQTLRAILFATLAAGTSTVDNLLDSADADAMLNACKLLGAKITKTATGITVVGTGGALTAPEDVINAGNSGIVLRFISAVSALGTFPIVLTGDHSIRNQRPMETMLGALTKLGVTALSTRNNGFAPLIIQGPITQTKTTVNGVDSQPVSSLLILGAFSKKPIEINVIDPGEIPWIKLTLDWMDFLNVPYENNSFCNYKIGGGSPIKGFHYTVPGDMSSAAFSVAAAVIAGSSLIVQGLDFSDRQGDKLFFDILKQMGAQLTISHETRTLEIHPGSKLKGITVDINDCIDAICILAVTACYAAGETRITNASVARNKECNRIEALVEELSKMGADIKETEDGLCIQGKPLNGAEVDSHADHRMAMSLAVAALGAKGKTCIKHFECIKKTYPTFINDFKNAGAHFDEHHS